MSSPKNALFPAHTKTRAHTLPISYFLKLMDPMQALSNSELDKLWDSVSARRSPDEDMTRPSQSSDEEQHGDAARKRRWTNIGVKAGETSFEVEKLRKLEKRRRILPEDGTWVEEDAPEPSDVFGREWREEELSRQKILEDNPDYMFLTLVAGASNTQVELLYDEDSLGEAMRRRLGEQQVKMAAQEASVEIDKLQASLIKLQQNQVASTRLQGEVTERQTTGVLASANIHYVALTEYVGSVAARSARVDVTNLLEKAVTPPRRPPFASMGDLALRVINAQFSGDESAGTNVPPTLLSALIMWDIKTQKLRVEDILDDIDKKARASAEEEESASPYVTGGDVRVILRGLHSHGWRTGKTRDIRAPGALIIALKRLISLKYASTETRDASVRNFMDVENPITRASVAQPTSLDVDTRAAREVLAEFRKTSWKVWLGEAEALVLMLETGVKLLEEKSPLSSPTLRQVPRVLRAVREDEPPPAQVLQDRAEQDAPNLRIMAVDDAYIDKVKRRVERVKRRVVEAKKYASDNPGAQAGVILRKAKVVGGPDLADDMAFKKSSPQGGEIPPNVEDEIARWANAMSWYEELGGDLFIRLDVEFPVTLEDREAKRGGKDVPIWSAATGVPPPSYSTRMIQLWNRHTPTLASAISKVADAIQRTATAKVPPLPRRTHLISPEKLRRAEEDRRRLLAIPVPKLTRKERIVYRTLKGVMPEAAALVRDDRIRMLANDSVLVVSARLYEAELAISEETLREEIDQRGKLMLTTRERIDKMLRGEAVVRAAPRAPYHHRRGWVEQPEHSGVVRMRPIVVQSIGAAWSRVQRLAPNIAEVVDIEFAQHDPQMRVDFAELVSVEMAIVAQRFPKQYIQLGQRAHTMVDMLNVMNRFRRNYSLRRVPMTSGASAAAQRPRPTPAPGAAYVAEVTPVGHARGVMLL